jgi:DNA processing protein
MDAHELRARTAWGLIADPADTLAWQLHQELGPIEALGQVLGSHNIRALRRRLSVSLTEGEVSLESLHTYRSRYSPDRVQRALEVQLEQDITAISPAHPWWPQRLGDLGERAPSTLWVKGSLHQASGAQGVDIVGSSRPTRAGRQAAIALSDGALENGFTILSGGTRGVSTDAHRRAVNGGGINVAVVAGGLESVYPPDNASLFARVLQRGALVSEVPATVAPTIRGLLARNRVVAALVDGVVVVQAEYRSGAISIGYHATALGRHVGVVPGPWNDTRSAGCWRIYRECGAIVLTEPAEISLVIPGVTHPTTI